MDNMGKKGLVRRVYTKEFKAEAAALAEKREKPVGQIAKDLGLNKSMLGRWMTEARQAAGTGTKVFPGRGRPRDEELTRLRKENKALKDANEILKKAAVIFAQSEPR
jgi:transposase-like protein